MKKVIWALLDDRAGSVGQAKGVIQFLDKSKFDVIEKKIVYNKWAKLPNFFKINKLWGMNKKESSPLAGPYPDAVLSISRRTTPIARYIKSKTNGECKIIQLMKIEKWEAKSCDLLAIPKHDAGKLSLPQAIYVTGSAHRTTPEVLADARKKWMPVFEKLPQPLTTVIIGGSIKGKPFTQENALAFGETVRNIWEKTGGSILITSSRRTGKEAEETIMRTLKGIPAYTFLWGEKKENPYMGFLACADRIIASGDSVSMCSESCGTGKPVLIFMGKGWLGKKHKMFCQTFFDEGYACPADAQNAIGFSAREYINPSLQIAEAISQLF